MTGLFFWLVARLARWMRRSRGGAVAVAVTADLYDARRDAFLGSIALRHDTATGKIFDGLGRELISVEVRINGARVVRRGPHEILRALTGEVLAGQMITLLFVEDDAFKVAYDPKSRSGMHFVDATCVWIDPVKSGGVCYRAA
jgi:hypothetical protein